MSKIVRYLLPLALLATGLFACAGRPDEEMAAAETALESARSAEADLYATELLQKASADFEAAMADLSSQDQKMLFLRSYGHAEQLFISAKESALKAHEIGEGRQREARAAKAAIDQAKIQLEGAQKSLGWVPAGVFSRGDVASITDSLASLQAEIEEAEKLFEAQDFAGAKAKAVAVMQQSSDISGRIRASMT